MARTMQPVKPSSWLRPKRLGSNILALERDQCYFYPEPLTQWHESWLPIDQDLPVERS